MTMFITGIIYLLTICHNRSSLTCVGFRQYVYSKPLCLKYIDLYIYIWIIYFTNNDNDKCCTYYFHKMVRMYEQVWLMLALAVNDAVWVGTSDIVTVRSYSPELEVEIDSETENVVHNGVIMLRKSRDDTFSHNI